VTSFYPQKLALTWPTRGGRSFGIVRLRTQATDFVLFGIITPHSPVKVNVLEERSASVFRIEEQVKEDTGIKQATSKGKMHL
jgi:hypothetical protein